MPLIRTRKGCANSPRRQKSPGESRFLAWASSCPLVPKKIWTPALDADGGVRGDGDLAELTDLIDPKVLAKWPAGMRVIVRRERPRPGAQLSLFEERDGWRYGAFVNQHHGRPARFSRGPAPAHARVEERIRHAKDRHWAAAIVAVFANIAAIPQPA